LLPGLVAALTTIIAAQLLQGGFVWLPGRLSPDWSRLYGLQRRPLIDGLRQALFALLAFAAALTILCGGLWMLREPICETGRQTLPVALADVADLLGKLALPVLTACAVLLGLEYGLRLRKYHASLRLSITELRDEAARRTTMKIAPAEPESER
jgi:flagellar biosynthesis protein FlhB